jgi:hypothetical protein
MTAPTTDDVRLRLGNAETVEDKTTNHRNQAMTARRTLSDSRPAVRPEPRPEDVVDRPAPRDNGADTQ